MAKLFRIIDADGDGSVSLREIMTWWSAQLQSGTVTQSSWHRLNDIWGEDARTHSGTHERLSPVDLRKILFTLLENEWVPYTDETGRKGFRNKDSGAFALTLPSADSWAAEHLPVLDSASIRM